MKNIYIEQFFVLINPDPDLSPVYVMTDFVAKLIN